MMCEIPSNDHRIVQLMLVRYLGTSTVPVTHKDNSQLQAVTSGFKTPVTTSMIVSDDEGSFVGIEVLSAAGSVRVL